MGKKVVHVEFPAQDADRGQKFWEGVGGWSIQNSGMPGIDYRMFQEGDQGGAVYPNDRGVQGPVIYLGSEDIEGNPFSLFQSDESVPTPQGAPGA